MDLKYKVRELYHRANGYAKRNGIKKTVLLCLDKWKILEKLSNLKAMLLPNKRISNLEIFTALVIVQKELRELKSSIKTEHKKSDDEKGG